MANAVYLVAQGPNGPVKFAAIDNGDGTFTPLVAAGQPLRYADGRQIDVATTLGSLLSDDFGGTSINAATWDVIDGGLGAITSGTAVTQLADLPTPSFSQTAIGTGTTGITHSVGTSALAVVMGTTASAERWFLSRATFAGKEDIIVTFMKSQALAANHIWIGLVEVDPASGIPLLNPNLANEFTNKGGCQFGLSATNTAYNASAIGDSSPSEAAGVTGTATAWTTSQETLIEIDSRDIIVQTASVDAVAAKAAGASRVSSQCPNDGKIYKLLMRFKNIGTPGSSTTVTIGRILVVDNYEHRVQVSSAEGDTIAAKGLPVNVTNTPTVAANLNAGTNVLGSLNFTANTTANGTTTHKLISAATTNATSVKASAGKIVSGSLQNTTASTIYFKVFNKASAPTVGTDTPVNTYAIPPNGFVALGELFGVFGKSLSTGIAYAITGAAADNDTTAVTAGAAVINLDYV